MYLIDAEESAPFFVKDKFFELRHIDSLTSSSCFRIPF